jgi:DNA-binding LytR/AlgR family response regulator
MQILIIEDEPLAAEKLIEMLKKEDASIEVMAVCNSVASAIEWLNFNHIPELGFFDIQLGDGTSFEIFNQANVPFPVIFITAFDHFAIKAFKVNSVDYLLKPVEKEDLKNALDKYQKIHQSVPGASELHNAVQTAARMISESKKYKGRFVVSFGEHIRVVRTSDIVCFYSEEKTTFLLTGEGKNYYLDQSLNQLETEINPSLFFRTSRKEIVNLNYVSDIVNYSRSRLKVKLKSGHLEKELIVSRDRIKAFKKWLTEAS